MPTVEARAIITLSKIQLAQADSNPLEKWHVIGTHSVWGGEPRLTGGVGKQNARVKFPYWLPPPKAQTAPPEGSGDALVILTVQVSSWWSLPSALNQRFGTCPAPIHTQTQKKRKRKQGKWVGVLLGEAGGGNAWEFFYMKRKTWNVLSTHDSWTAKPVCLAILIYDKNQLKQKGYKGRQWRMGWQGDGGESHIMDVQTHLCDSLWPQLEWNWCPSVSPLTGAC